MTVAKNRLLRIIVDTFFFSFYQSQVTDTNNRLQNDGKEVNP